MPDCPVCADLATRGFGPCLAHAPQRARVWPRETTAEHVAGHVCCGDCGAVMRACLRGWRCTDAECGAIALLGGAR